MLPVGLAPSHFTQISTPLSGTTFSRRMRGVPSDVHALTILVCGDFGLGLDLDQVSGPTSRASTRVLAGWMSRKRSPWARATASQCSRLDT